MTTPDETPARTPGQEPGPSRGDDAASAPIRFSPPSGAGPSDDGSGSSPVVAPTASTGWGAPAEPPGYASPDYGRYSPGGASGYAEPGKPGQPGHPPQGYGPLTGFGGAPFRPLAARPGIIPLRPLGLGEIYDGAFGAIRANPKVMLGVVALVISAATAVAVALGYILAPTVNLWLDGAVGDVDPTGELGLTGMGGSLSSSVLQSLMVSLASIITTGVLIVAIGRAVLGRSFTVTELWSEVRGKVVGLVVIALVPGLLIGVVTVVAVLAIAAAGASGSEGLLVIVSLLALLGLVAAAAWVTVRLLLAPAAYVLEGQGLLAALKRGWTVSRRSFWRLLGIYVLSVIITNIVSSAIVYPAALVAGLVLSDPNGWGYIVVTAVAQAVAYTITTTFLSSVVALLYIDVRMRREGLDVELAAAADAS
ncbi:hypothetical protein [Sanguibacter suaedae]|uniref:DUF7847 domain-containing protein n=1 Tax=Sanguibacter suaedae TaxID=2795737 RepID=A0A934I879_9MICO|nr:hypothetical protein [Sanguibacter suaedae]MBI9116026.1 hypothetical protein [Sanguibacter suaedae]